MKFNNFLGNETVKKRISDLINSSRLPHAIIIEGDEGIGKRTLARDIACALVCRAEGEKPCGSCSQCVKAQKGIHPDIYEYSAPGGANSFHIEIVRKVIKDVYMSPNESEYKIYILANAHCMNANAQNALLKVLEEPPAYAVFILTVNNRSMMLETVLSRAVTVTVDGVTPSQGADYIVAQNPKTDYNTAYNALSALGGNIGRAMASIEGGYLQKITDIVNNIAAGIAANDEYELLKTLSALGSSRQDVAAVLEMLKTVFRDALTGGTSLSGQSDTVSMLKGKFTRQRLFDLFNSSQSLLEMANKNANSALMITKICYTLREAAGR